MQHEKRLYPRYSIRLQVQYQDTRREMLVSSKDISQGGIFLNTANPPGPETIVSMTIELPDNSGPVRATGHVVHCIPGMGMGIAFDRFDPGAAETLKTFLQRLSHTAYGNLG